MATAKRRAYRISLIFVVATPVDRHRTLHSQLLCIAEINIKHNQPISLLSVWFGRSAGQRGSAGSRSTFGERRRSVSQVIDAHRSTRNINNLSPSAQRRLANAPAESKRPPDELTAKPLLRSNVALVQRAVKLCSASSNDGRRGGSAGRAAGPSLSAAGRRCVACDYSWVTLSLSLYP